MTDNTPFTVPTCDPSTFSPELEVQKVLFPTDYLKFVHPFRLVVSGPSQAGV